MDVLLMDGNSIQVEDGSNALDVAKRINQKLGKKALCAGIDGKVCSLSTKVEQGAKVQIFTFESEEGKKTFWHTASHILAQAVKRLYPKAKLAIGPAIDNGFYYDFDVDEFFTPEDLKAIEKEMKKIVNENLPLEYFTLPKEEALAFVNEAGETYKAELIEALPEGEIISFYKQGEFTDLCAGPHLPSTNKVKAFKLTSSAGAYWRGDEKNKMLNRVYGTAFESSQELDAHLKAVEEALKRDHNKLGRELEFFTTCPEIGQGLPLLMPKGAKVVQVLQRYVEDMEEAWGYQYTRTPFMAKSDLYKISGHWQHYRDGMFVMGDEEKDDGLVALRPMTCPFQFMIYKSRLRSYRDLPVRYNETATLFRNESSGEMHGLIRVRQFTLSDGHIICTPDQVAKEFKDCISLTQIMMKDLGIAEDITYRFSKWDPSGKGKYIDNPQAWESTQAMMKEILDDIGLDYKEADGEAAFYGPKLDFQFKNVFGKEDTLFTVQIDFALADRFDMEYVDSDNVKKRPFIVHRSSIGCYERTLAMLIEKYAGALPLWIAPEQVRIMSITESSAEFARQKAMEFKRRGLRVTFDDRQEKIGYKIREARNERIPYMLVVGEKEVAENSFAVRKRGEGEIGTMGAQDVLEMIVKENDERIIF